MCIRDSAATDLPAAQFASVSGSGACAANEQAPATYTGTFAAKLQMTELLKPFETQVKSEADDGHFPWDKETVSTSASFYYTVTFPQLSLIHIQGRGAHGRGGYLHPHPRA